MDLLHAVGQASYNSTITLHVEELPVTVDILGESPFLYVPYSLNIRELHSLALLLHLSHQMIFRAKLTSSIQRPRTAISFSST